MHPQSQSIYDALERSGYDRDQMLVLADAIEEFDGDTQLAATYRWAARNDKWPWERSGKRLYKDRPILWDWDSINRKPKGIPEQALLHHNLYRFICNLKDKKYDSIHDAFVLLSTALHSTGLINDTP